MKNTMEEKKIRRNLYRVLRKTGVQKNDIQPEASFRRDLNFDSVDWKILLFTWKVFLIFRFVMKSCLTLEV
jgi:acyl carrier protein